MIEYREILLKQKEMIRESLLFTTDNAKVSQLMFLLKCVNLQLNAF